MFRYDPKENKWGKVAPMTTRRLGVAVAVLGGYLYAIGGSDGQCPLNTGSLTCYRDCLLNFHSIISHNYNFQWNDTILGKTNGQIWHLCRLGENIWDAPFLII